MAQKTHISISTDKKKVTEGEIVTVSWQCSNAPDASTGYTLTIDNGTKSSTLAVEASGSKSFRLNRTGNTRFALRAENGGQVSDGHTSVKVKPMPVTKGETVDANGKPIGWMKGTFSKLGKRWDDLKRWKQALPPQQQVALTALVILMFASLLSIPWPTMLFVGNTILTLYLVFVLFRRK